MKNYEDISDKFWNLKQKGKEELQREQYFIDDIIQKAHIDREIEKHLEGVKTVLDAGAGTGRFSIPLAKRGLQVTHFDISESMIEAAKSVAIRENVDEKIHFVKGKLTELTQYPDNSFDLVLCFDAPISYCFPNHHDIIKEIIRISKRAFVLSVSGRYGYAPYYLTPCPKEQFLMDENVDDPIVQKHVNSANQPIDKWQPNWETLDKIMKTGLEGNPDEKYSEFASGKSPWPVNYLFTPEELLQSLQRFNLSKLALSGPGAYARTLPRKALRKLLTDSEHRNRFLDFCHTFDSLPSVIGLSKDNLVASGIIINDLK